jgi:hypothetical protein
MLATEEIQLVFEQQLARRIAEEKNRGLSPGEARSQSAPAPVHAAQSVKGRKR